MFNKTTVLHRGGGDVYHHTNVEVTEKRAPTDESVRLLSEMEEKAVARITDRMVAIAGDNAVGAVVWQIEHMTEEVHVAFTVNGVTFKEKLPARHDKKKLHEYAEAAVKVLSEKIAARVVAEMLSNMRRF